MKIKVLILTAVISISFIKGNAQVEKGAWLIGGEVSYSNSKADYQTPDGSQSENKVGSFNLSIGHAFRENNIVGLFVMYAPYKVNYSNITSSGGVPNMETTKNVSTGIGAYYRGYKPLGNKFYFWGQASASYNRGRIKNISLSNYFTTSDALYLDLSPGLAYEVLKNVHIEVTLPRVFYVGYANNVTDLTSEPPYTKSKTFDVRTSLSGNILENLGIGFKLIF